MVCVCVYVVFMYVYVCMHVSEYFYVSMHVHVHKHYIRDVSIHDFEKTANVSHETQQTNASSRQ